MDQRQAALTNEAVAKNHAPTIRPRSREQDTLPRDVPFHFLQSSHATFGDRRGGHWIRPKLRIGAPNDAHEREIERAAGQVMRMPESRPEAEKQAPTTISHQPASDCPPRLPLASAASSPASNASRFRAACMYLRSRSLAALSAECACRMLTVENAFAPQAHQPFQAVLCFNVPNEMKLAREITKWYKANTRVELPLWYRLPPFACRN